MPEEILKQLGFSEKEVKVYLAIVRANRVTPTQIAKETGINRTTVYSVASDLIKKGLITEDLGGTKSYLVALPIEDLGNLTKPEEEKLEIQKSLITQAITQVQEATKNTPYSIPKLVFIPEEQLKSYVYSRTPVWNQSIHDTDGVFWGFQDHTYVQYHSELIDWYWKRPDSNGITLNMLTNESEFEKTVMQLRNYEGRNILFWKKGEGFQSSTWVNGDFVIFLNTAQHPFYLIELHDVALGASMRQLFKGIWDELIAKRSTNER